MDKRLYGLTVRVTKHGLQVDEKSHELISYDDDKLLLEFKPSRNSKSTWRGYRIGSPLKGKLNSDTPEITIYYTDITKKDYYFRQCKELLDDFIGNRYMTAKQLLNVIEKA